LEKSILKINGEDLKSFRIWVLILRALLMGIPAVLAVTFEWLYDNCEIFLSWLDRKLPDPHKESA